VRLPQSTVAFKAIIVPFLLVSMGATSTFAQEDGRLPLYSCGLGEHGEQGWIQLDGVALKSGPYADLRLEVRTASTLEFSFPPPGVDGKTAFLFSHSNGPEGYLATLRFVDRGTNYVLYSLYTPPDPNDPSDAGGGPAGLVSSRDGRLIKAIECVGGPYEFIEYMRESTSCDTANPLGAAACESYEPKRTAPLDIKRIGIAD
jgi:hypothetical protein